MLSKSEQIEVMKSAGYSEATAKEALQIGVFFFGNLKDLKVFDDTAAFDKGMLNDKEVYFIDTSIAQ